MQSVLLFRDLTGPRISPAGQGARFPSRTGAYRGRSYVIPVPPKEGQLEAADRADPRSDARGASGVPTAPRPSSSGSWMCPIPML